MIHPIGEERVIFGKRQCGLRERSQSVDMRAGGVERCRSLKEIRSLRGRAAQTLADVGSMFTSNVSVVLRRPESQSILKRVQEAVNHRAEVARMRRQIIYPIVETCSVRRAPQVAIVL
jgi:hypothetical protein